MTTAHQAPDLSGFLMAHRGFRAEFGRLAAVARAPRDDAHAALIDDQIDLVLHVLHHHHTAEDTVIWPLILGRSPDAHDALARLEDQHEDMDPLFTAVADRTRPVAERSADLQALHEMLNAHLDEEERAAVPLILRHIDRSEWAADGKNVQKALGRRRLPLIFGWLASTSTREQQEAALRDVPWLPRMLFRRVWGPAYARRFVALYGDEPAVPLPV
jgi:hypothetical protein